MKETQPMKENEIHIKHSFLHHPSFPSIPPLCCRGTASYVQIVYSCCGVCLVSMQGTEHRGWQSLDAAVVVWRRTEGERVESGH